MSVRGGLRLTRVGGFGVDLVPEGRFLVTEHDDRPGVIGCIGTMLGGADVNIASIQVSRDAPRGRAMMFFAVDEPLDAALLGRLDALQPTLGLRYVELGDHASAAGQAVA